MVKHMVKDHSYSASGNPLPPLFSIKKARGLLYAPPHRQDSTYHILYTSHGALAGMRKGRKCFI